MQRVDLLIYFDLSQSIANAKRTLSNDHLKAGAIYFSLSPMNSALGRFIDMNDGFNTCKHVARELVNAYDAFHSQHLSDETGMFSFDSLEKDLSSWHWHEIKQKVDAFTAVFTAECRDIEIYSVGQLGIYNMNSLVSNGSSRFPEVYRPYIPFASLAEFDNAGRCLAFNLPTACGFHSLRGLELSLAAYLQKRSDKADKAKSWNDYLKLIESLQSESDIAKRPSPKVHHMIQRMKDLDRNPLMHPRDTLDIAGADQLFNLCSITTIELARDDALNLPINSVQHLSEISGRQLFS